MSKEKISIRAVGLVIDRNQILAVQENDSLWCFPGGRQELGETQPDAIMRELNEEVNLHVIPVRLLYIAEFMSGDGHVVEFYWLCSCHNTEYEIPKDEKSVIAARWIPMEQLHNNPILPELVKKKVICDYKEFPVLAEYLGTRSA